MNPQTDSVRAAIQAALQNHESLVREKADLIKLQETLAQRVTERSRTAALDDTKAIREIGDDQARLQLLPERLRHLDERIADSLRQIEATLPPVRTLLAARASNIQRAAELELGEFVRARITDSSLLVKHENELANIVSSFDAVRSAESDALLLHPAQIRTAGDYHRLPRLASSALALVEKIAA